MCPAFPACPSPKPALVNDLGRTHGTASLTPSEPSVSHSPEGSCCPQAATEDAHVCQPRDSRSCGHATHGAPLVPPGIPTVARAPDLPSSLNLNPRPPPHGRTQGCTVGWLCYQDPILLHACSLLSILKCPQSRSCSVFFVVLFKKIKQILKNGA